MTHVGGPRPGAENRAIARQKLHLTLAKLARQNIRQVVSQGKFSQWCAKGSMQLQYRKDFKTLDEHKDVDEAIAHKEEQEKAQKVTQKSEQAANEFTKRNPEIKKDDLLQLLQSIKDEDSIDEIIKKLLDIFPDHTLAYEAIDFLLETSKADRFYKLQDAKNEFYRRFKREIIAGTNIHDQVEEFAKAGLANASQLRDLYKDVTGVMRTPHQLFDDLTKKYTYEQMKYVIFFLLHALGADLKSKGPSITHAELHHLLDDTRTLQAILGIYRFFRSRMALIEQQFALQDIILPYVLTFDQLAKQFVALLEERFISSDKILRSATQFNLSHNPPGQVILFTQFRDAIRNVSPKLFRSQKHKEEVLMAFIELLEQLEEEGEEE